MVAKKLHTDSQVMCICILSSLQLCIKTKQSMMMEYSLIKIGYLLQDSNVHHNDIRECRQCPLKPCSLMVTVASTKRCGLGSQSKSEYNPFSPTHCYVWVRIVSSQVPDDDIKITGFVEEFNYSTTCIPCTLTRAYIQIFTLYLRLNSIKLVLIYNTNKWFLRGS